MKMKRLKSSVDIFSVVLFVLLSLYVLVMVALLAWAFFTSLKTYPQFRMDNLGLPKGAPWDWAWANYVDAFEFFNVPHIPVGDGTTRTIYLAEMFLYSFLYAGGCAFFAALIPCITAYATSRYDFYFSKIIYTVVIVVMALPIVGSLPAEITVAKALNIYGEIWGVWILKANFLGMYYLVFHAYFKGISKEYYEAAYLDGAGEGRIFTSIVLPLVRNIFFTIMLIKFIEFWNDYQTPLIYTPNYPPVAYGLYRFHESSDGKANWPTNQITASMLMMLPTLILFIIFHNKLIGNISMGGVKE